MNRADVILALSIMEHINLSQQLIDQYKEAFSLFDEDGDGLITGDELGIVIRALGHTVTEAEIDEMILGQFRLSGVGHYYSFPPNIKCANGFSNHPPYSPNGTC